MTCSSKIDGGAERARDIARLFLKCLVVVKVLMRGRVGLHVSDIAISLGHPAGGYHIPGGQPVGQKTTRGLGSDAVSVSDDTEMPALQMLGIRPSLEVQLFGLLGGLAMGRARIRIAAVGAYQPINHCLEASRCLVPINRCDNENAARRYPKRVDFVHPVVGLA